MSYFLDDLRREGYVTAEPALGPTFTIDDDGSIVMEWPAPRLAVRLSAAAADGLAAGVADARRREAETEIDDAGLGPPAQVPAIAA
jgi:hypothetical protein